MIIVKQENIYGIDVFRFNTSNQIPYQLTFEKDLKEDRINIHLANLFALENCIFDKDIRKIVCDIISEYLISTNCVLFFEINVSHNRNDLKMIKFLKWANSYGKHSLTFDLTEYQDVIYSEVYIRNK